MDFHKRFIRFYGFIDWIVAVLVWSIFFYMRKYFLLESIDFRVALFEDSMYWYGIFVIPMCWLFLFFMGGSYRPLYKQSFASVLFSTFWVVLIGSLGLLMLAFYDDLTLDKVPYARLFLIFFVLSLVSHLVSKLSCFTYYNSLLNSGKRPLNSLRIYNPIDKKEHISARFRTVQELTVENFKAEDIIAMNFNAIFFDLFTIQEGKILLRNSPFISPNIDIRAYEANQNVRLSQMDLSYDLDNDSLIIELDRMTSWQQNVKRFLDIVLSVAALVVSAPLLFIIAFIIKIDSPGSVIYKQLRVGKGMNHFSIYKFRSMNQDAEQNGPELSRAGDQRITGVGRILRRYHIDEIPQFINVLLGDMSIVGPRPERPFFVDLILDENQELQRLYSVQPGITSWGQVKYGYASSIKEIMNRTRFDLLYLDNRSLYLDFRIIISTIRVVLFGHQNLNKLQH